MTHELVHIHITDDGGTVLGSFTVERDSADRVEELDALRVAGHDDRHTIIEEIKHDLEVYFGPEESHTKVALRAKAEEAKMQKCKCCALHTQFGHDCTLCGHVGKGH